MARKSLATPPSSVYLEKPTKLPSLPTFPLFTYCTLSHCSCLPHSPRFFVSTYFNVPSDWVDQDTGGESGHRLEMSQAEKMILSLCPDLPPVFRSTPSDGATLLASILILPIFEFRILL